MVFFFSLSLYGTHTQKKWAEVKKIKREEIEINTTVLESKRSLCCRTYYIEKREVVSKREMWGGGILYANSYRVVRKRLRERLRERMRQESERMETVDSTPKT